LVEHGAVAVLLSNSVTLASLYFSGLLDVAWFYLSLVMAFAAVSVALVSIPSFQARLLWVTATLMLLKTPRYLRDPHYGALSPDVALHVSLTNLIVSTGSWTPGMGPPGVARYSYYPGMHIFSAVLIEIGRPAVLPDVAFVIAMVSTLSVVFLILLVRRLTKHDGIALWCGLIFALNQQVLFYHSYYVYEAFAAPLAMAVLFLIVMNLTKAKVLTFLVASGMVISHHWLAYSAVGIAAALILSMGMAPLVGKWLRKEQIKEQKARRFAGMVSLLAVLVLGYVIFVAVLLLREYVAGYIDLFMLTALPSGEAPIGGFFGFAWWEIAIVYLGYVSLGLVGVQELIRRFLERASDWRDVAFVSGGAFLFVALLVVPRAEGLYGLSQRSWFASMALAAPLTATGIARLLARRAYAIHSSSGWVLPHRRLAAITVVSLVVLWGFATVESADIRNYTEPRPYFFSNSPWVATATWCQGRVGKPEAIIATPGLDDVLNPLCGLGSGQGRTALGSTYYENLVRVLYGSGEPGLLCQLETIYVAVDNHITATAYMNPHQFHIIASLPGGNVTLDDDAMKLNTSPSFDTLYSNGYVSLTACRV